MTLKVSNTYLYENDKPFFWFGDTAWLMLENLELEEIKLYLKNRASLGFNVIQVTLFHTLPNEQTIKDGMNSFGKKRFTKEYFNLVNDTIKYAKTLGIYIALLPSWGAFVKENIIKTCDAKRFAEFLVNEFGDNENLIWVLGGDILGTTNIEYYNTLGNTIKSLDSKHLMTFHPFGRTLSARWFNEESWLDFNMFQSGHRRYDQSILNSWDDQPEKNYAEDNYLYVKENMEEYKTKKPVIDGEPSYEGIVQGLHDYHEPYWEAHDVRRYAYWSVFEGACGFTYGNNAVMQFHTRDLGYGSYGVRESWQEALHSEGGAELQFLKKLMLDMNFITLKPSNNLLVSPQKERYHHISIMSNSSSILVYDYSGDKFELDLSSYKEIALNAYWMNPQNGSMSYINTFKNEKTISFRPTKRHELSNDWVLILKKD